jgi:xanthine dehydrogenase molybdenum-binding subunit
MSRVYPAERANGKNIVTIEGLAERVHNVMKLHPLQEAFVKYGAVQCGFCIPGQIMTAYSLLKQNPDPNSQDVRFALKDTLCRCAGYPAIEKAILAAAHTLRTGEPLHLPDIRIVPQIAGRTIGPTLLKDDGHIIDDRFKGMLYGKAPRSGAHAFLKTGYIEPKRLRCCSRTDSEDIPGEHNHGLVTFDWPAIVGVGSALMWVIRSRS